MGKIQEFIKKFAPVSKGIINQDALLGNTFVVGGYREQNPLTENIYNTIANDVSLLGFREVKEGDNTFSYDEKSDMNKVLNRRTNELQSPSEFWQVFTYNLVKYGNGIAIPIYEDEVRQIETTINNTPYTIEVTGEKTKLVGIENINIADVEFGYGYSDDGEKYLLVKSRINGTLIAYKYDEIIHVRYRPKNVFYGDRYNCQTFNQIADIYDANITQMLNVLSSNGKLKGILKLKVGMGEEALKENKMRAFVNTFMGRNSTGIAVLDSNEEFQQLSQTFEIISKDDIETTLEYLYNMFGVNPAIIKGNYTMQEYNAYYNHTLEPIIKQISEEIEYKLVNDNRYNQGYRIKVNKKLIVGASLTEITNFMDKAIYHGVATPNQVADIIGLDHNPDGDKYYTNLNAVEMANVVNSTGKGGD